LMLQSFSTYISRILVTLYYLSAGD
jgi:hypothetical protein